MSLQQKLAPLLFEDEEIDPSASLRVNVERSRNIDDNYEDVIQARRSDSAIAKDRKKRNEDNLPVHSSNTVVMVELLLNL
ncbi:hypothetical protein [Crocosphaera sp. Alani8]|uniref:hypothetical protein n=1 Tax=Crocosphaera sp. Alani8 TaxID=3038952 RepID=UPI00313D740E